MQVTIDLDFDGFDVPSELEGSGPDWFNKEVDNLQVPLTELDAHELGELCDDFRAGVFCQAEKKDPYPRGRHSDRKPKVKRPITKDTKLRIVQDFVQTAKENIKLSSTYSHDADLLDKMYLVYKDAINAHEALDVS